MRCHLPVSNNSSEVSGLRDLIRPSEVIHNLPKFRTKRSGAMYLIKSAPWNIAETRPRESRNLLGDEIEERMALVSRGNILPDEKDVDRDLDRARDNFATIFHASPAILCIIQLNDLRYCEINKAYEQRTGYTRREVLGKASLKLGLWSNVEERKRMFQNLLAKGRVSGHQEVFQTKTGESLTTFLSAEIIEFDGEPCALVVAEDITLRQRAEEAQLDLAQRLVNAQEAESSRVGRELHDNIGQSLALFGMELERTRLALSGLSPDNEARLDRLCHKLKVLGRDVGNLSHQLHSSGLEMLGLAVAIKTLCREFSEQYHVQTRCNCSGVPRNLPADVSLCLFRVLQEALQNVAKHSQATMVNVEVYEGSGFLRLSISDDGVGFAPNIAKAKLGIGLISMRERLHLVGGKFIIAAKPGSGTRVEATVPSTRT
jgi:PAS domain S-box-containing protein